MFKHLGFEKEQLHKMECVKLDIEHKVPQNVGFFSGKMKMNTAGIVLSLKSNAMLQKLEARDGCRFTVSAFNWTRLVWLHPNSFENLKKEWDSLQSWYCTDDCLANTTNCLLSCTLCTIVKKHETRELGFFEEEFRFSEMVFLFSKAYCCYGSQSNKFKLTEKSWKKQRLRTVLMDR